MHVAHVIEGDRAIIYANNKVLTQSTVITSLLAHNPFMRQEEISDVVSDLFNAYEEKEA